MELIDAYQEMYYKALHKAGIPIDATKRTPDQQNQSSTIFLAVSMEAAFLPSITQVGLENA